MSNELIKWIPCQMTKIAFRGESSISLAHRPSDHNILTLSHSYTAS